MAEVLNELDFRAIDEAIEGKRLAGSVKTNITSFVETKADWDEIPAEQPPKIDWAKINANKPTISSGGGFNWSHYQPEDEDAFFNFDDDLPDTTKKWDDGKIEKWIDDSYVSYKNSGNLLPDKDDLSYYRNTPARDPWWDDVGKTTTYDETTLDDLYNMTVELQTRVDTMSSNVDDLTDMVKSQYKTMMKMINAIYQRVNL
jgi:hypothetical protein